MPPVRVPAGFRLERLSRAHPRVAFASGEAAVDAWLHTMALQSQEKHLSVTTVLLDEESTMAGYYTLATGQVDFAELPADLLRRLPKRRLPVTFLAWLGVSGSRQGQGLGRLLLVLALRDCFEAGKTFAFVAVVLDCINDRVMSFYQHWGFRGLPGHPQRLFLSAADLEEMMARE